MKNKTKTKMKRTLSLITIVLFTTLVGCSQIDDTDPTVSKLEVVMNIETISSDILNYFNVEYTYIDFHGQTYKRNITGPESISFYINNPTLGEESSTPFTVQMTLTKKGTAQKESGSYDASFNWQLDVNAYDQKGNLITDSGRVQRFSSNVVYNNDKFSSFTSFVASQAELTKITYTTFFCKTTSGEWHIGVEGLYSGGQIVAIKQKPQSFVYNGQEFCWFV